MEGAAFDALSRHLVEDKHYLRVEADSIQDDRNGTTRRALCHKLAAAVAWVGQNDAQAAAIGRAGRALVQKLYSMPQVLAYMHAVLQRVAALQDTKANSAFRREFLGVSVDVSSLANASCVRAYAKHWARTEVVARKLRSEWRECGAGDEHEGNVIGNVIGNAIGKRDEIRKGNSFS